MRCYWSCVCTVFRQCDIGNGNCSFLSCNLMQSDAAKCPNLLRLRCYALPCHHNDCQHCDLCPNHQLSFSSHCVNLLLHCIVLYQIRLHCIELYQIRLHCIALCQSVHGQKPFVSPEARTGPYLGKLAACFNSG